jgi:hypothetical protein
MTVADDDSCGWDDHGDGDRGEVLWPWRMTTVVVVKTVADGNRAGALAV